MKRILPSTRSSVPWVRASRLVQANLDARGDRPKPQDEAVGDSCRQQPLRRPLISWTVEFLRGRRFDDSHSFGRQRYVAAGTDHCVDKIVVRGRDAWELRTGEILGSATIKHQRIAACIVQFSRD